MIKYVTSESVTIGHPDKLCDYIADSILDEALKVDKNARVACEVMASKGEITVAGEITLNGTLQYEDIVNNALLEAGYNTNYSLHFNIHKQSVDIKNGVDNSLEKREIGTVSDYDNMGAGDQGIVLGYACNETPELMPLPIMLAHKLAKRLQYVRETGEVSQIKPDGKTQVTVKYVDDIPYAVDTILISTQHEKELALDELRMALINNVIYPVWKENKLSLSDIENGILVNPSGNFVIGGPEADTGVTGRKLMVDSYGGGHHGGGAFPEKIPQKLTGAVLIWHVTLQKLSLLPDLQTNAKFK